MLRTALALSCLTCESVEIDNIRAGRSKPGLRPQHSAALTAAASISNGDVEGNKIGSKRIVFKPGKVEPGPYRFDVGTAGSTLLVLHTVYLPLTLADDSSRLKIEGGTHVPWSPPFEHSDRLWRPALRSAGIEITLNLLAAGFYPKGGGRIDVKIKGGNKVGPIRPAERGPLRAIKIRGAVANLDDSIADRMIHAVKRGAREIGITGKALKGEIYRPPCPAQGAYVFIQLDFENARAGFVGLGAKGKRAEIVAAEAWEEALDYIKAVAPVEPHLADQILLPLSIADGESEFTTTKITSHLDLPPISVPVFMLVSTPFPTGVA